MAGNTKAENAATKPVKRGHKTAEIHFRVSTKDRGVMEAAAKAANLTLSDWMRRSLLLAATTETSKVFGVHQVEAADRLPSVGLVAADQQPFDAIKAQPSRPDPDKLAAFQRRAGMGGVKSRG